MKLTRRRLGVLGGTAVATGIGLTYGRSRPYVSRRHAGVPFEEPIVTDGAVTDGQYGHPHYTALLTDPDDTDLLRWDYLAEEIPPTAHTFTSESLTEGFIVVFGVRLPRDRKLSGSGTRISNASPLNPLRTERTLTRLYEIRDRTSASDQEVFYTAMEYWETNGPPPVELSVEITDSPETG